jgi:hypothetical protein
MIFGAPISFQEALQSREVRSILPTELGSAELERISSDLLERATFSARVANAEYLQEIEDVVREYVDGKIDLASARTQLKAKLEEIGYAPTEDEKGKITDFSSDARTNLVLRTNAEMAHGYGQWMQGQNEAVLNMWPAQELYRAFARRAPRDWQHRFTAAGGIMFNGRMLALKNSATWSKISRFGTPYPPFDFNSGMSVRDVDRNTAMHAGLIDLTTQVKPETRDFNQDLEFSPGVRSEYLRQALTEEGYHFDGDTLTL